MNQQRLSKIAYGGDYNPDQWPRSVWEEDARLFKIAKVDIATVGVFSWALLQPDEQTYNFQWLDELMDHLDKNGIMACLATSTAAVPAWMAKKYPEVLRTDFEGREHKFGGRHNFCPNSPVYRKFSRQLAERLAARYGKHPALQVWHVNNEYGGICYCDRCAEGFRVWLQARYKTLEALNEAWNTRFWGHTFCNWGEIYPPNILTEHMDSHDANKTAFQPISLDYWRFNSESLLKCFLNEKEVIKKFTPEIPVTTNFLGTQKQTDYFRWAEHMDVVSWDNYPRLDTPPSHTAMRHDLMRGLRQGQSFMLMEQTPSQQNWQPYNSLKRPGVMKLQSFQAVAHGADAVMFFQLRRTRGACEKFHGAMIEHAGHENTRVFRECAELGSELTKLGDRILGARVPSRVAILFDWENWWAIEFSSGPSVDLKYLSEVQKYYDAFYSQGIQVDMVGVERSLESYDLVVAPVLYMVKPGLAKRIERFVESGGFFLTTFFSGVVNETDLVTLGGYPGELRDLLGVWVEEIDALPPGQLNRIILKDNAGLGVGEYTCELLFDLMHAEGAEVVAEYGEDFYCGMPVVTKNQFGQGEAWYIGSSPDSEFLLALMRHLCLRKNIQPVLQTPEMVEVTKRVKGGREYLFLLNHGCSVQSVNVGSEPLKDLLTGSILDGTIDIPAKGVRILERDSRGSS